jgi:hypothetical protein
LEPKVTVGVRSVGKVTERLGAKGDGGKEGTWRLTKGVGAGGDGRDDGRSEPKVVAAKVDSRR